MVNKLLLMKKRGLVPGAIAYWDCTQVVGQVLPDLSGNGNHATLGSTTGADTNDPTPVGTPLLGIRFDGDDLAVLGDLLGTDTPFTLTVVTTPGTLAATGSVVSRRLADANNSGMYVNVYTDGRVIFGTRHADGSYVAGAPAGSAPAGSPIVVCATYTGSEISLYVNGVHHQTVAAKFAPSAGTRLTVGRYSYAATAYYIGDVHTISVHPFTLSPTQIAQNHAYFRAKFAPLGVVLP